MDKKVLASMIDHTLLKPATKRQLANLCDEAKQYGFASVCVNPCHVKEVAKLLEGSAVKVCTVVGFPLGENDVKTKVEETKRAIKNGATEIDVVMNQSLAKSRAWVKVQKEIAAVKRACGEINYAESHSGNVQPQRRPDSKRLQGGGAGGRRLRQDQHRFRQRRSHRPRSKAYG